MEIIVFHGNNCSACHAEMEFLEARKIPYTARNVSTDLAAREELIAMGSKTVPTTLVDGKMVIGFDLARIEELIAPRA